MTNREALYREILENPDDDTLRLIYADALEEEGDEQRAAFIRTQVRLAGVPEYDPAWFRARYVDRDVLAQAIASEELPALPDGLHWASEPFRRGLPAVIQADDAAAFVTAADGLFSLAPIEALDLHATEFSAMQDFARCPWRNRLVRLSLTHGLGGQLARGLFGPTEYERLRDLHIGAGMTTRSTCRPVVRSQVFKRLTALSYRDDRRMSSPSSEGLVDELVKLADLPRLQKLDLARNGLTAAKLRELLAAPVALFVEELDLSYNPLGPDGLGELATARLPHLRSVNLSGIRPEAEGIGAFFASETFSGLRRLALGYNSLVPVVAERMSGTERAVNLRVLDLSNNKLGNTGASALAGSPHLRNLACLDLSSNQVDDDGARALLDSPYLSGLFVLNLAFNNCSDVLLDRLRQRFGAGVYV